MQYTYADITIAPYDEQACDIVSAMLCEIGYDSFEMTDYGMKAYIPTDMFDEDALSQSLSDMPLGDAAISHTIHQLEDKNWNEEWEKNGFVPVLEEEFGIKLSPKMAFGSGTHETTHQIVSILMQQDLSGKSVLDMGTGTGVLAIAASMRGAKSVTAIDIDEHSVANAKENLALNGIHDADVILGDASAITGTYDVIIANIHKNILTNDMATYVDHLAANGTIYISGFFTSDVPEMTMMSAKHHLKPVNTTSDNGWAVMQLERD